MPRVTLLGTLKALVYDLRQRQIMHVFMHYLFVCLAGTRITLPTCLCASLCTHSWKMCLITSLVAKKIPTTQFPSASRLTLSDHTCSDISVRQFTFDMFIIAAKHVRVSGPCRHLPQICWHVHLFSTTAVQVLVLD